MGSWSTDSTVSGFEKMETGVNAREGDAYDFTGEGDKGQYIYVSPQKHLVIIRNSIEDGMGWSAWIQLFYRFASQY